MTLLAEYSFNAGSGSTVADSSGNGHNLTLPPSARAQWVTGKNGGGLSGGTAAYVVNDPTANGAYGDALPWFPFAGSWTVALWAKIPSADGRLLWDISQNGSDQQIGMEAINNAIWFLYPGNQFISSNNYADSAWHHWAWTYNSTTHTSVLYVDGAIAPTTGYPPLSGTNLNTTWTAAQFSIVGVPYSSTSSSGSANGTVDDFRIFDTALSQSDVQTWMNTPAGASGATKYAAAGTVAAVTGVHGNPTRVTRTYAASGTVSGTTGVHGAVSRMARTYAASGTAAAVSHTAGGVTARLSAAGHVAAVTSAAGSPTARLPTRGTVTVSTTATGSPTARLVTHGAVAAVSGIGGTANIIGGARTYDVAGTITSSSGSSGTVRLVARASGVVNATTAIHGSVTIASNTPARDIDVTASPVSTGWQVMGTTGYPITTGAVNNNNGYNAGTITVDPWTAAPLINYWSTGPVWIQES